MSVENMHRWFQQAMKLIDVDPAVRKISGHRYRDAAITRRLQQGIPKDVIMLWVGHFDEETTKRYTQYEPEWQVGLLRGK